VNAPQSTAVKGSPDPRLLDESSPDTTPVVISAALPPNRIIRTRKIWSKLLHAAVLPLLVGVAVFWLEGEFSADLFQRAWPVMALLAAAYVGAWVLSSKFERFPFINQFEGALVSVSVTLVPAGLIFAAQPGSPINTLALIATGGSIAWYLADKFLHRYRRSRLLVLPGGAAGRLFGISGVSTGGRTGASRDEARPAGRLDGIVADLHASLSDRARTLAEYSMKGLPTYHAGYIYELLTARVFLGTTHEASVDLQAPRYYPSVKRAMDLLLVGASLPITGPIMALTALAIRLESKGSVLFWQKRVGRGGEPFWMAKFRSMYAGNEGEDENVFASEEDDRVTTVGRIIRKLRIDELPQFWNVLKGEMSLIGPRPEQVGLAEDFDDSLELYHTRHLVRPGITGWAQVLHGYAADQDETRRKLEHDLYYVKHRSVILDLLIVYLTLKTILTGFGAR
jgi:lipopolysaccharide/colanic/teichoic acid biosynthesis glycosyltransferase